MISADQKRVHRATKKDNACLQVKLISEVASHE